MTHIAKNLRFLRKQYAQNLTEFARTLDLWEDTVRRFEQGKAEPDLDTLVQIAKQLALPIEHLLLRDLELQDARLKVRRIGLVLLDVDGTLTDGTMTYDQEGRQYKSFHVRDGMIIHRLITRQKLEFGFISGGSNEAIVQARAKTLGIDRVYCGPKPKLEITDLWLRQMGLKYENVVYLGDDVNDLPVMRKAGLSACPADAPDSVKREVNYVLKTPGGKGCVRELMENLLGYNIVE